MLRSNLHQLVCIEFCSVFSNFVCQMSSQEEVPWALAVCRGRDLACPWCFTSSMSAWSWCCALPGPSLPWRVWLHWGNPGFQFLLLPCHSSSSPTNHCREGSQPWAMPSAPAPCQLWRHPAASPRPTPSSDLPVLECDLPRVADQTPPASTTASGRGFLPFSMPLSQPSGRGRLLYTLSEMTCGRVRFRDSRQRSSTQACLVKCTL